MRVRMEAWEKTRGKTGRGFSKKRVTGLSGNDSWPASEARGVDQKRGFHRHLHAKVFHFRFLPMPYSLAFGNSEKSIFPLLFSGTFKSTAIS